MGDPEIILQGILYFLYHREACKSCEHIYIYIYIRNTLNPPMNTRLWSCKAVALWAWSIRGVSCSASPHMRLYASISGDQEDQLQVDSSTPSGMHESHPSDLGSGLTEQLQGLDSFSLPPGLFAPEVPDTPGIQSATQAQAISLGQLQTQVGPASCPTLDCSPDLLPPPQSFFQHVLQTYWSAYLAVNLHQSLTGLSFTTCRCRGSHSRWPMIRPSTP